MKNNTSKQTPNFTRTSSFLSCIKNCLDLKDIFTIFNLKHKKERGDNILNKCKFASINFQLMKFLIEISSKQKLTAKMTLTMESG